MEYLLKGIPSYYKTNECRQMESITKVYDLMSINKQIIESIREYLGDDKLQHYILNIEKAMSTKLCKLDIETMNNILKTHFIIDDIFKGEECDGMSTLSQKIYKSISTIDRANKSKTIIKICDTDLYLHIDNEYITSTKQFDNFTDNIKPYMPASKNIILKEHDEKAKLQAEEYLKVFALPKFAYLVFADQKHKMLVDITRVSNDDKKYIAIAHRKCGYTTTHFTKHNLVAINQFYGTYKEHIVNFYEYMQKIFQHTEDEEVRERLSQNMRLKTLEYSESFEYICVPVTTDTPITVDKNLIVEQPLSTDFSFKAGSKANNTSISHTDKKKIAIDYIKANKPQNRTVTSAYYEQYATAINDTRKILSTNMFGPLVRQTYEDIKVVQNGKRYYVYRAESNSEESTASSSSDS